MRKTVFAGLTVLDPGESLASDGFAFQSKDPDVIDRFLELGAVSHRHNARPALVEPTESPSASAAQASGGTFGADVSVYVGYTLVDTDGRGETTLADPTVITTDPGMDPPEVAPSAVVDYGGGVLPMATYYYALTLTDDLGGETVVGPYEAATRDPGFASGRVTLTGMGDIAASAGAAGWRLYRSKNGGAYQKLTQGDTTDNNFVDDGTPCTDCTTPPDFNTTGGGYAVTVVVPSGVASAQASAFRLYISDDGSFASPALYDEYPLAFAGTDIVVLGFTAGEGSPPTVSTCAPGANMIDPDTELIDWHWKRPVATSADLPSGAASGDVRVTLDTGDPWRFVSGTWDRWPMSGTVREVTDGTVAVDVPTSILFIGSGGASATVAASGASAVVTLTAGMGGGGGGLGTVHEVAADAPVEDPESVVFVCSGGASATATASGASAIITFRAGIGNVHQVVAGGTTVEDPRNITFIGSGGASATVAASGASALVTITAEPGAEGPQGPSGTIGGIQDEGSDLPQRPKLDFVGAGVTATDDSGNGRTVVTVPGGGGGATVASSVIAATETNTVPADDATYAVAPTADSVSFTLAASALVDIYATAEAENPPATGWMALFVDGTQLRRNDDLGVIEGSVSTSSFSAMMLNGGTGSQIIGNAAQAIGVRMGSPVGVFLPPGSHTIQLRWKHRSTQMRNRKLFAVIRELA